MIHLIVGFSRGKINV